MLRRMNRVNQLISDAENFSAGRINHSHPPPPHLIAVLPTNVTLLKMMIVHFISMVDGGDGDGVGIWHFTMMIMGDTHWEWFSSGCHNLQQPGSSATRKWGECHKSINIRAVRK